MTPSAENQHLSCWSSFQTKLHPHLGSQWGCIQSSSPTSNGWGVHVPKLLPLAIAVRPYRNGVKPGHNQCPRVFPTCLIPWSCCAMSPKLTVTTIVPPGGPCSKQLGFFVTVRSTAEECGDGIAQINGTRTKRAKIASLRLLYPPTITTLY